MRKIILILGIWFLIINIVYAEVSHLIRYQGVLVDKASQQPLSDGSYQVTFRIYDDQTEGNKLWEETQSVSLTSGTFSTLLGSAVVLNLAWDKDYWITLQLEGETEMSPRQRITPVPLAIKAEEAEKAKTAENISGAENIFPGSGNVGIGTTQPQATLEVGNADSNTVLLLHMNEDFTDETDKTVTTYGNAQIDTAQSVFGGASALFDGTGDYLTLVDSTDWDFNSDLITSYTIDFWLYPTDFSAENGYFGQYGADSSEGFYAYTTAGTNTASLSVTGYSNNSPAGFGSVVGTITKNVWQHIAIVKNVDTWKMYIDGILQATATQTSTANFSNTFDIGRCRLAGGVVKYLPGQIDEFRVSKGIARWTSNFTPPASEYTYGGGNAVFAGNVGIGTTSPQSKLHVRAGTDQNLRVQSPIALTSGITINSVDDISNFDTPIEYRASSHVFTIGDVGIGTTTPTEKLEVTGNVKAVNFLGNNMSTGDITFNKDGQALWRMFEDEDGLYAESLKTGKIYKISLEEVSSKIDE